MTTDGRNSRPLALLALLLLVPAPTIGTALAMGIESTRGTIGPFAYGFSKIWILALPLAWRVFVDRERPSLSPVRRGGLRMGLLLGFIIAAFIFAGYWVLGRQWIDAEKVRESATTNGIGSPLMYVAFAVYLILVNSLLEEYVWRWFVFRKCETLVGGGAGVVLSALFFTAHHVIALKSQLPWNVTIVGSLGVFVGGAVWSWCYLRYRSIWPGYVSHLVVDVPILVIGWMLVFG